MNKLTEMLLNESPESGRCEHLKVDSEGPYCSKDLIGGSKISEERRAVCDSASLQLWCLDNSRCNKCIFYSGNEKFY